MNRPWMPLYVADYLKDTAHLGALESGAYLHLIMHYWANGGLPDDDKKLGRIARMTPKEWMANRATLQEFFSDGWKHKRIEFELTEAARISNAGRTGGLASAKARRERSPNDKSTTVERPLNDASTKRQALPSPSLPNGKGADAPPDPKVELFTRARAILGDKSGGSLTAKLLRSIGPEDDPRTISKARARIEEASTKAKPAEWLGRVMSPRTGQLALTAEGEPYPEGII